MASASVADAGLEYLKKAHSLGAGQTVYEHITKALLKILEHRPKNALAHFETALLDTERHFDVSRDTDVVNKASAAEAAKSVAALRLIGDPAPALNEEGEPEDLPEPDEYAFFEPEAPEVAFRQLALCGRALPAEEAYSILMAMKRLGGDAELKVEALRFFGKFFGTRSDYYVFECRMVERPEKPEVEGEAELPAGEAPAEAETGANKYMYYVCTSLGGPFTLLGDVTPAQIKVARQLKKLLIGDLAAPVATYPPFPGSERHYLRAQIARIAHSTVLCPKGLYTAPEDGAGDPEPNEEYAAAPVSRMLDPASWCHWTPHLKAMGVTVLPEVPEPEDEEHPPVLLPEQTEKGPAVLALADADATTHTMPAWSPVASSCSKNLKHQVAGVSSNLWPGALAVTDGAVWANVYVGWGLRRDDAYAPLPPPSMQADAAALEECNDLPPPPPAPEAEEEE